MKRKKARGIENINPILREDPPQPVNRKRAALFIAVLLAAVAVTYANAIKSGFIFDDFPQVVNNPYIRSWQNLPAIFGSGFGRLNVTGTNYYRPVLELSYMANYALCKMWAPGYHVTNILFHATSAIVLFFLITKLFRNITISFLTALIFCVHPIYTVAVTYVSGRADSMVITFMLISFFFILNYLYADDGGSGFLTAGCFFLLLSLLTKENAVFLIPAVFLYRFCIDRDFKDQRRNAKWTVIYAAFSIILLLYMLIRANAVTGIFSTRFNVAASVPAGVRFLTGIKSFLDYLILLIAPTGLHFERTTPLVSSIFDLRFLAAMGVIAFFIFVLIRWRSKKGPVFCGLAWYVLMFLPVSNLFMPLNAFIAENWVQLPALGIFLVAGALVVRASKYTAGKSGAMTVLLSKSIMTIFLFALVYYAGLTISRNNEYSDPVIFYKSALRYEPKSLKLINNLGVEMQNRGDVEKAENFFKRALAINPNHPSSLNNLARIYIDNGRYDDAVELLKKALAVNEKSTTFLNNIGVAFIYKGDKDSAVHYWRRSLELNPNQPAIQQYIQRNISD